MQKKKQKETKITINFPDEVKIDFVPSNEIKNYERFQWLITILTTIAVGFWTAYFTTNVKGYDSLFFSAVVFSLVSLLFIILAFLQRKKIFNNSIQKSTSMKNFK